MSELLFIVLSLGFVGLCGVFVAAEFSLIAVHRPTVERLAKKGDRKAKGTLQALKTLSTQLSGAQVGITLTNLAIGFLAEPSISSVLRGPLQSTGASEGAITGISLVLGVVIATVFTMIFGELVPKNFAIAKPLATARVAQAPQRWFTTLMHYPIKGLNNSANYLIRRMGIEPQEELASARSADELTSLVRRSAEQGTLPKETALMLERSLGFGDLTALDVMTPRTRARTLKADDSVAGVLGLAKKTGHSRFPVVETNLDDTIGIVHIKQALAVPKTKRQKTTVRDIMKSPIIVPSSIQLEPLLRTLKSGGLQMAVLIDEFGGADGIVTIEDLIEELVGDVRDEHDKVSSDIYFEKDGAYTLSGLLRPDEIGQRLGIYLPDEEEFETIGGLIADRLEHIPKPDDSVNISAINRAGSKVIVRLVVKRMDGRRVDQLHMNIVKKDDR